ncbi:MAG: rhamnulokinase [Clostridia bacterium]|nr:rhamnulokinase [Clostridia bacterium]
MPKFYLAIDIGASSGRHIVGYKDERGTLQTVETYRFPNGVKEVDGHLTWEVERLVKEVKSGIRETLKKYPKVESMSIDTWGVDYVLLEEDKEIMPVYAYRDSRTKAVIGEVHEKIPFEKLYAITGSQFQEFNTLYQLYDDLKRGRLERATDFLFIPEYLMYKLTGVKKHEYTNASTTGMLSAQTNDYSKEIISVLGLKESLFKPLEKPKTPVGSFTAEVQAEVGGNVPVVLCPTHDTASAVEGIPMEENAPYVSSGTWSLLGIKSAKAFTSERAMRANYSNEYGPNYIRFQKNIMGLWIIQCLAKQTGLGFEEMVNLAKSSEYTEIFNVNDERFLASPNMKKEIAEYFLESGKPVPQTDADVINSTYRSLAYSYKVAYEELEEITGEKYGKLYIVGGGAKNKYLNQLTEEYTAKKVVAFPIEATAIGNLLTQIGE